MELVENAAALIDIFGRWPSFHDAEVIRVVLDRGGAEGPTLHAEIHVWRTTAEIDGTGHFVQDKHTLVSLRFFEVNVERLDSFNHQNVLFDLEVSAVDPALNEGRRMRIDMPASDGLSASFSCTRAMVVEAVPYPSTRS